MSEEKVLAPATVKIVLDSLSMPFATRRKNIENTRTLVCKPDLQTLFPSYFIQHGDGYFGHVVSSDMLTNYEKFPKFALFTEGIVIVE